MPCDSGRRRADEDRASRKAAALAGDGQNCTPRRAGRFGDVVESAKKTRRGRRVGPIAPPRAHGAMASARRARRCCGGSHCDRVGRAVSVVTLPGEGGQKTDISKPSRCHKFSP